MPNLDYVELREAADAAMTDIEQGCSRGILDKRDEVECRIILAALTAIAKRALASVAWKAADGNIWVGDVASRNQDNPPVLYRDACAALDAPKETADV